MIYLKNITKNYGAEKVLDKINASLPSKGVVFIKGVSGGGKTTLLNIIGGLLKDYEGEVYFKQKRLNKKHSYKHLQTNVSYIMQSGNLTEGLTLRENLEIPFRIRNLKVDFQKLISALSLENLLHKKVKFLSLGEQQRAALARSILTPSKVLLLDEPTGSLNEENTKIVMEIVQRSAKKRLIIFVTHNETLIRKKDSLFILKDGRLEGEKLKEKYIDTSDNKYTKTSLRNLIILTLKCVKTSLKQIIMLSLTISSIIVSSLTSDKVIGGLDDKIRGEFSELFKYKHLQKSENKKDLSLTEFKNLTEDFKVYLEDYFYDLLDPGLYDYKVSVSDFYLGNGFVMSATNYIDADLKSNQIIIGEDSNSLCESLIIRECNSDNLKEFLKGKTLLIENNEKMFSYNIKDYLETDSLVIFSADRYLNEELIDNPEIINYYFIIKEEMLSEFYNFIKKYNYLTFDLVNKDENIFKISVVKHSYYSNEELKDSNFEYIYCSNYGYNCLANYGRGRFEYLNSIMHLDIIVSGKDVTLGVYQKELKINEIVISNALKEKMSVDINEFILLRFGEKDVFLKVVDTIENDELIVYQNSYWTYSFFKESLGIENLRSNLLLVEDNDLNLPSYYEIKDPYDDVKSSLDNSFQSSEKIFGYLINLLNLSSLILIACLSYLLFDKLKKVFGIFLLLGMSNRDVSKIIMFKHKLVIILTSLFSLFYLCILKMLLETFSLSLSIGLNDIMKIIFYSLITAVFSLFISITVFRRSSLLQLIKNK